MRHCVHCGQPIALEVMVRGRWKAIFCSPACHDSDRSEIRRQKAEWRKARGKCPTCGKSRSSGKCASAMPISVPAPQKEAHADNCGCNDCYNAEFMAAHKSRTSQ